jgi:predicted transposase/invertase (TIGR01784 family)
MRFISPRTDFAFKKIFGSENSHDILISFLNAILYEGQPRITDLEIINPLAAGQVAGMKDSYLDVQAILDNHTKVIIEMQVVHTPNFAERIVYNLGKSYGNQLNKGETYRDLKPVIALTITDFMMDKNNPEVISSYVLTEEKRGEKYLVETLKLVLVELPKFRKGLEQLETITDQWIYFLKNADSLETVPTNLQRTKVIEKALDIANRINMTKEELENIEKAEMFILDQQLSLEVAKAEAEAKGEAKGRAEGRAEGQLLLITQLVKHRYGDVSPQIVSQISSLSSDELSNLATNLLVFTHIDELINWLSSR